MGYTSVNAVKEQQVLVQNSERMYSISARAWQKFIVDLQYMEKQRFSMSTWLSAGWGLIGLGGGALVTGISSPSPVVCWLIAASSLPCGLLCLLFAHMKGRDERHFAGTIADSMRDIERCLTEEENTEEADRLATTGA